MLVWRMTKLYTDECRTQTIVYRESVREEGRDRETTEKKKTGRDRQIEGETETLAETERGTENLFLN